MNGAHNQESRYERGVSAMNAVDPGLPQALSSWLGDLAPDLARLTIEFGYGDVMSRPGLDLRTRELLNVAMLAAMGTAPHQLDMHMRAALHCGVEPRQIVEVVLQVAAFAGFPAAYNAVGSLKKILEESTSTR